ncbi:MAG TPA: nicotinate-nucleotide adenylyltransferase [Longimicrobiales bacterium]|nr:nicotinate-nucleotide adenylyltransferase [Longimicrobiales bacterium]
MSPEGDTGPGKRIALFGGTFDPPHFGHLVVAQDVVETLELDALYFVPAGTPPHKRDEPMSSARLRLEMVRAAVRDDLRLHASAIEVRREGPSYTVDTLRELEGRPGSGRLFFVMGVDQFAELHTWKEPAEVARLSRLVVITREGDDPEGVDPGVDVDYDFVPVTRIDISSTRIRERVREGRPIRYLVPEAVRRIIERERLYLEPC